MFLVSRLEPTRNKNSAKSVTNTKVGALLLSENLTVFRPSDETKLSNDRAVFFSKSKRASATSSYGMREVPKLTCNCIDKLLLSELVISLICYPCLTIMKLAKSAAST